MDWTRSCKKPRLFWTRIDAAWSAGKTFLPPPWNPKTLTAGWTRRRCSLPWISLCRMSKSWDPFKKISQIGYIRPARSASRQIPSFKLFASPKVSADEFKAQCQKAAESMRKDELDKLSDLQKRKTSVLQDRLDKEERELSRDKSELSQRTTEEVGSGLETVLSFFGGRKRSVSTNLTKRRMTSSAKANVDESVKSIELLKKQIAEFENDFTDQASRFKPNGIRSLTM